MCALPHILSSPPLLSSPPGTLHVKSTLPHVPFRVPPHVLFTRVPYSRVPHVLFAPVPHNSFEEYPCAHTLQRPAHFQTRTYSRPAHTRPPHVLFARERPSASCTSSDVPSTSNLVFPHVLFTFSLLSHQKQQSVIRFHGPPPSIMKSRCSEKHRPTGRGGGGPTSLAQKNPIPPIEPRSKGLDISAEHGLSLRGSYRQGYSTTYNTRSDIKVVCNGYIPAHISNCNSTGGTETFTSQHKSRPCTIRGTKPICIHVRCTRVNIATFWHGF